MVKTMWKRFLFWMRRGKDCGRCCLKCPYYKMCRSDIMGMEEK
jgi:hypothetical protein